MGAGRSKHPDWYPGEPAADALATCSSCQTAADKHRAEGMAQRPRVSGSESTLPPSDRSEVSGLKQEHAPSGSNDKFKREPSSLPVVELVDFEVGDRRSTERLDAMWHTLWDKLLIK